MRTITTATTLAVAVLALAACDPAAGTTPETQTSAKAGAKTAGKAKAKTLPIKLVAKRAHASKSVLSDGGALSCVKVTVTNQQAKKSLDVNPLYFSITDTKGVKHSADRAMGEYDGEMDATTLAPGEKAVGMVCGKGAFVPKILAMTNPLFSEAARAEVA